MDELVTLAQAKRSLRLTGTQDDDDVRLKLSQAQALVVEYVRQRHDAGEWAAEVDAWTEETVPPQVTAAILLQCTELFRFRGDDTDAPVREFGRLSSAVEACLNRLRDPSLA